MVNFFIFDETIFAIHCNQYITAIHVLEKLMERQNPFIKLHCTLLQHLVIFREIITFRPEINPKSFKNITTVYHLGLINFSVKILKKKGVLISKLFMGEDFLEVKKLAESRFKKVRFFKPEASRDESKETYLHCAVLKTL